MSQERRLETPAPRSPPFPLVKDTAADLGAPLNAADEEAASPPGGCTPEGCASVPGPALAVAKGLAPPAGHEARDHGVSLLVPGLVRPVVLGDMVNEIFGVEVAGPQVAARPPLSLACLLHVGKVADVDVAHPLPSCGQTPPEVRHYRTDVTVTIIRYV